MKNEILNQYKLLVNFLGKSLGPSFEVVLHEVKGEEVKMIAIANGEVSDRVLEDTVSSETINILKNKSSHNEESMVNHTVLLKNGKKVRSSIMLIKENQKVVGMLCVNFDDSKFHELNCQLLRIIHPDMFVKNYLSDVSYNVLYDDFKKEADEDNEDEAIDAYMKKVYYEVNTKLNFPIGRPTRQEREQTIYALYERGFFNLKDSIDFVSKKLFCSTSTVYRYIALAEKNK